MKSIAIIAALIVLAANPARASGGLAPGDYSCNYASGNITLERHDFDKLAFCKPPDCNHPVTDKFFASLKHGDAERRQICDSRALARKIHDRSVTTADFKTTYSNWVPQFFAPDEQETLMEGLMNSITAGLFRNIRTGLAVRTCEPPRS